LELFIASFLAALAPKLYEIEYWIAGLKRLFAVMVTIVVAELSGARITLMRQLMLVPV
jgi:hypothetical protein